MHRFFVPAELLESSPVTLPTETSRQIARVLRLRPGAQVTLFAGDGAETAAVIEEIGPRSCTVALGERSIPDVELPAELQVAVATLKGEKLDWVIQKLTELGAARIRLIRTERTVVIAGEERWPKRRERFERIAREAAEQSGRVRVPRIEEPVPLTELVRTSGTGRRLILDPLSAQPLAGSVTGGEPVLLAIGPEGGFTAAEVEAALASGFQPVSLGRRVLRAETAAIAAAAVAAVQLERRTEKQGSGSG